MKRRTDQPPLLIDPAALAHRRARAQDMFWHREISSDVSERLGEIKRKFDNGLVISPFGDEWSGFKVPSCDHFTSCQEAERLSIKDRAFDLILHALALHMSNDPLGQLIQCHRALCAGGLFMGFLFGGNTLYELRSCLSEAEIEVTGGLSPRVVPMAEIRGLGSLLQRAGFVLPVADCFTKKLFYRDLWHLMRDLRSIGEANALQERIRYPTRRALFMRAAEIYDEKFGQESGTISATFEIICLTGWRPDKS